jgi:uncharacterized protein (TIGR02246 family)
MKTRVAGCGLAVLLPLAGAAVADGGSLECSEGSPAVAAARAVAKGIVDADNRGDLDAVMGHYANDAVLMPPGEAPLAGREKIRPRYRSLFADFSPGIELRIDEACAASGLGFVRGHNGGRLVPRAGGEPRLLDDAFLMLLRLESDGAWRISHLIWHRQGAPTAPARSHAQR